MLNTNDFVDITQMIPKKYLLIFAIALGLALFIADKIMKRLFWPDDPEDENSQPAIFEMKNKKRK